MVMVVAIMMHFQSLVFWPFYLLLLICSWQQKEEVMLASYSMLRGFLNALDAHDKTCSNFFICQAAQESSKAGQFGQLLAKVASSNAESWLTSINATLHM